jgi:seryl-tRNA synthetase
MLDIKLIREKPQMVKANLEKRGNPETLNMLQELIEPTNSGAKTSPNSTTYATTAKYAPKKSRTSKKLDKTPKHN